MAKLTKAQKNDVIDFAVAYKGYYDSVKENVPGRIYIWAAILMERQGALGVELVKTQLLLEDIAKYREICYNEEQAAA
jgi:hypothetical protein